MPALPILVVALPTPLRRIFDYLAASPESLQQAPVVPIGARVLVPFGNQQLIGIVVASKNQSDFDPSRIKPIIRVIDHQPLLSDDLLQLCQWAADYYHHPLGEVLSAAIPSALRLGDSAEQESEKCWILTAEGISVTLDTLKRSPQQRALIKELQDRRHSAEQVYLHKDLLLQGFKHTTLKSLAEKSLIAQQTIRFKPNRELPLLNQPKLTLNNDQAAALEQIQLTQYNCYLLHGTTGSGKTEVYLQAIEKVLSEGKQALVLIPEIGLTPQTLGRFQRRFNRPLTLIHSGLNDNERKQAWLQAAAADSDIIIGTRSAIFTPMKNPGIIILDEEHDLSFKQQDGFRYSARDLATIRAQRLGIPLIMGSATPSLESLLNADSGRYQLLQLPRRAGDAKPPAIELVDLKHQPLLEGMTQTTLDAIRHQLESDAQVLVFINRRGFAPTLLCHDCGWVAKCPHCDARLTVHQNPSHLHCHHCDHQRPLINHCPSCNSRQLNCLGQGTERTESLLQEQFPDTPVIRVDRDSTSRKQAMQNILDEVNTGKPCILVGTQMLAKGHHFPNVTLAVILDADSGLFSTDFRGPERMAQLIVQVAGRAGRESKPGKVLIQTHVGDHPLLQTLLRQGYNAFAKMILQERHLTQLPPYRYMALLRAESKRAENAIELLQLARKLSESILPSSPDIFYLGPLPAPMERRNQRFRYQLQINATSRGLLHQLLLPLINQLDQHALSRRTRWSVDIDPQDMS